MAKYVKTEQGYINMPSFAPAQFKPEGKSYLTFSSPKNFTLEVNNKTKNWDGILEYFAYDKTWTVWDGTTTLSAVFDDGEYFLYLRGTGNKKITGLTNGQKYKWVLTGSEIACTGNIENLLDYGIVESGGHPTMASYCYNSMFYGCTALTQAPDLPAKTLIGACYSSMFYGCTSLTQAPELPATTLKSDCYQSMFEGCTALTQAPALPATTLANYCYQLMFEGCTALTQAPALPATTLANNCYSSMFSGCTSLTKAPALPATTLADYCYRNMFYGCTALTQAPDLPATTLADYCYESMFYGCTSLTKAPALPAKTLIGACYSSMFYGCSSLTQAPELPATSLVTLVTNCYDKMFYGCRSIKLSSTQTGEYTQEYIVGYTSNYAYLMFHGTGGTFTGTPVKDTYYLSTDNMIVRDTEVATLNGYVGSMIDNSVSNPLNITGATVGQIAKITAVDESGKPTSWEAVDGGVQPDWNQNDETAADYVKNRPFYTGNPVETVLVEESTVSFAPADGIYMGELESTFSATVGETYKVSWDGTAYECACVNFSGRTAIGNLSIAGPGSDTGEPFIMVVDNGQGIAIGTADTSASHTFSICVFAPEVVKIDPKYIRDMYYTGDPVETVLVEESTVSFANAPGGYTGQLESTFEATVGETYKVYWDGAAYECTCVDFHNTPVIGNLAIAGLGSDTGEPFLMVIRNGKAIRIGTADTSASHTFSISGLVSEVVKIDPKYLPDTIATKSEVEAAQTTADDAWTEANNARATASNAQTTASNAQTTASNAQTTANNAKSEALDLAARMFGHTSVVDSAFYRDETLSITSLPACIESIGNSAFSGCKNLALTSLPSGLTSIGNGAFQNCTKLALTSLPSGLTSIGFQVFAGCKNLALTSLPSGLTSIDSYAFSGCTKLALTSLPSGITSIGSDAFSGCLNLALTSLPNGLTSIGYNAFLLCTKLALTSLPSGLTSIGNGAFQNCTKLTSITFTGKPTTISSSAFEACTNLTTINVPWAEGEVANAPWGATNATINYNYTEA